MSSVQAIAHGTVVSMDEKTGVVEDGCLVVEGRIIRAVGNCSALLPRYPDARIIDASGKVVIPGLINCHLHSCLPLRGLGEGLPLEEWHGRYVDPLISALTEEDAYLFGLLTYAECIKSGTTTVLDLAPLARGAYRAARESGIRAVIAPHTGDAEPLYDDFESNRELVEKALGEGGLVSVWFGFDSFRSSSPAHIGRVVEGASRYGVGISTHSNESRWDVEESLRLYGKRPVEVLSDFGVLSGRAVIAHGVWVDGGEIGLLAERGAAVAHCPTANMRLADGFAPVFRMTASGVTVGLGTDGSLNNDTMSLFKEMKLASLIQKATLLDAAACNSRQALELGTISGARALGWQDQVGCLKEGMQADVAVVNLRALHLTPLISGAQGNVIALLVHSVEGADVETVLIGGRVVMEGRRLTTVDEEEVMDRAGRAARALLARAGLGGG